jgi:MFS family permease
MSTESKAASSTPAAAQPDPRRWKALGVLGLIQFMLILDITVVNVALPRIQHDLGFSQAGLAWVVNGYVLMAGGLLLLGGRLADILGGACGLRVVALDLLHQPAGRPVRARGGATAGVGKPDGT